MKIIDKFISNTKGLKESVKRFPITMIYALVLCIVSIYQVREGMIFDNEVKFLDMIKLMEALGFGLIMSLAIGVFIETIGDGKKKRIAYGLYILEAAAVYFLYKYLLEANGLDIYETVIYTKYAGIILSTSLLVYFIGRIFNTKNYDSYVVQIIKAVLVAFLNCIILVLGLYFILFTLDTLFNIYIDYKIYSYIYIIMYTLVFTAFTISGFPKNEDDFSEKKLGKVAEKIYVYVLMPLIAIYTVILYAFFIKVLVMRIWPDGIVSHLVLWYSLVGIFVLFFTKSVVKDSKLAGLFRKYYPISNIINLVLMFYAIYIRIKNYGFTVNRYIVLVAGIWVLLVDIFYLIFKDEENIIVPISMSLFVTMTIFGPFNAFNTSLRSQNKKLERALVENEILINGKLTQKDKVYLDYKNLGNINSTLVYIEDNFGKNKIKSLSPKEVDKLRKIIELDPNSTIPEEDGNWYDGDFNGLEYIYYNKRNKQYDIGGYNHMATLDTWSDTYIEFGDIKVKMDNNYNLELVREESKFLDLEVLLNEKLDLKNVLDEEQLEIETEINGLKIKLVVESFNGEYDKRVENSKVKLNSLTINIFL